MNELIQKFAEQADLFADSKLLMKGEFHPDWHDIRDEKFATLIVRECMRMCEVAEVGLLTHGLKEQSYGAVGAKQHISDWFEVDK